MSSLRRQLDARAVRGSSSTGINSTSRSVVALPWKRRGARSGGPWPSVRTVAASGRMPRRSPKPLRARLMARTVFRPMLRIVSSCAGVLRTSSATWVILARRRPLCARMVRSRSSTCIDIRSERLFPVLASSRSSSIPRPLSQSEQRQSAHADGEGELGRYRSPDHVSVVSAGHHIPCLQPVEVLPEALESRAFMGRERSCFQRMGKSSPPGRQKTGGNRGSGFVRSHPAIDGRIAVVFQSMAVRTLVIRQIVFVVVNEESDPLGVVVRELGRLVEGGQTIDIAKSVQDVQGRGGRDLEWIEIR